ncbi:glycyl-radical enzyme activating protein [Enterococcus sp. BWB1-3]|uniref:glycyl-radical enzyme activating protein n=1 Tax=unclassified Enterococcus TaxID=2608891 RepID=UPI001923CE9D|nr:MULTISPECIES: glycyl-radical enzyme activating protein [unclassified Enterococcus]MBL1229172.1 glycyl-radical enzyme activating protein [Enterococcus sp. BWB1-3]MCB5952552.1 glycyl-radical enzyme activating protein [Enterococcus sp. BWT-B8]MCB5953406.1 glycyl-radical enzyme activating protein [Enterococcus sp. CWB-B31]
MSETACIFNIQKFSIHDGPGIRTVVFFKGCPLKCYWCSNPESQCGEPEQMWNSQKKETTIIGEYKTIAEIVNEVMKDEPFYEESGGGVTLSGGEVLYQAVFATELLKELKKKNIHTACETTGYAKTDVFEAFIQHVDLLYFDVKHYDSAKHKSGIGVPNELILKNLQTAVRTHAGLVVRIPVIPFYNDSLADAEEFSKLFNEMGVNQIELLPFHQFGEKKYQYLNRDYAMHDIPQLHTEDLYTYKAVMEAANIQCLVR